MFPGPLPGVGALQTVLLLSSFSFSSSSSIPNISVYFGTKSRYEDVKPNLLEDPLTPDRSILRPPSSESCSPVHLTALIRHGTRYPTVKNIRRIQRLKQVVRTGTTGTADWWLQEIRTWENWYTEDMDGSLAEKGRSDLHHLSWRLSSLFPWLLSEENVKTKKVPVLTSSKHRCVSSAEAFQDGLHRRWGGGVTPQYVHRVNDELMRFFQYCRGYVEGVEKNRTAMMEVEKFKKGAEMEELRRRTAEKLKVHQHLLTTDLLEAAFFLCSYELAIKSVYSPWCFLFSESDAKVLEYSGDLKQFWKRAHGHVISGLSSCPLFHHIFRTLDKAGRPRRSTDPPPEPASILIGHAETLLPLLTLLGLYKDKTSPTASNYQSQHDTVGCSDPPHLV
ncbi:multiple inositol polyphosphate phosphatase 1b isoform 2-T2 [Pholidichthys leucotaenia]